ncbi:hypothetical protein ACFL2T_06005 [Elusimicrobiota bacterium]
MATSGESQISPQTDNRMETSPPLFLAEAPQCGVVIERRTTCTF